MDAACRPKIRLELPTGRVAGVSNTARGMLRQTQNKEYGGTCKLEGSNTGPRGRWNCDCARRVSLPPRYGWARKRIVIWTFVGPFRKSGRGNCEEQGFVEGPAQNQVSMEFAGKFAIGVLL